MKELTDKGNLEDEIRSFGKSAAGRLLEKHNAQIVIPFRDKQYLLSARSIMTAYGQILVEIRAREWIGTILSKDGGIPNINAPVKTASAIFDDRLSMQQFTERLIITLFFNIYGLIDTEVGEIN